MILPGIDRDTPCSLTSSIILSPAPRSRSPWLQQYRSHPGGDLLRTISLRSRAIVSSRAIVVTWMWAVREPFGPTDAAGNRLRKDERQRGTSLNGGGDCFGFSHDHVRGVLSRRAEMFSLVRAPRFTESGSRRSASRREAAKFLCPPGGSKVAPTSASTAAWPDRSDHSEQATS